LLWDGLAIGGGGAWESGNTSILLVSFVVGWVGDRWGGSLGINSLSDS